eukprot:2830482-Rhodomonas_salina.2
MHRNGRRYQGKEFVGLSPGCGLASGPGSGRTVTANSISISSDTITSGITSSSTTVTAVFECAPRLILVNVIS